MNYTKFLNSVSLARRSPSWKHFDYRRIKSKPNDGKTNPSPFIFEEAEFQLRDGSKLHLSEEKLQVGQQYTSSAGNESLLKWLKDFQKSIHNPPILESCPSKICMTSGSMEGLCKTFEMLVEPNDSVLIETPTYPGVLSALRPLNCNMISVETDHLGIVTSKLKEVLRSLRLSGKSAKFLYTVPNGGNPTGVSTSVERKREIYEAAREYDFLILEDDPYYFLQFSWPRTASYLSMDVDGRVLRFDSFSKILSSGLRLGFVSGPEPLVERIVAHNEVSSIHSSHISQIIACQLLESWGIKGFEEHVSKVVEFYNARKDLMLKYANRWLKDLAEWNEPGAGMFLWMKLKTISDTKKIIEEKAKEKKVLLVPGCAFYPDDTQPSPFVRAAYSISSEYEMDQGFKRLAELIREESAD